MHSQTVKLGSPPTNRHIFLSNQQHLASDRRDWETQGDKRETSAEPASQHLASDRGDWETQGHKPETRPWSQRHETGRHKETSGRQARSRRHSI